jgi:hypothetical protein
MFLAEIDRSHHLLKITVADHVAPEDARFCLECLQSLLADIKPGFRLLSDLSGIKSMRTTTAPYIGKIMELCADKGLESVVRVLPSEPRNDIGYAILSQFHYGPDVRIFTCDNVQEAASHLAE